jgi:hypothetical protein
MKKIEDLNLDIFNLLVEINKKPYGVINEDDKDIETNKSIEFEPLNDELKKLSGIENLVPIAQTRVEYENSLKGKKPANGDLFTTIISCETGTKLTFPLGQAFEGAFSPIIPEKGETVTTVPAKFKRTNLEAWYNQQKIKKDKGQTNGITACQYYTQIELWRLKSKNQKVPGGNESQWYQTFLTNCLTNSLAMVNTWPEGCNLGFYLEHSIAKTVARVSSANGAAKPFVATPRSWWVSQTGYLSYETWYNEFSNNQDKNKIINVPYVDAPWEYYNFSSYSTNSGNESESIKLGELEQLGGFVDKDLDTEDYERRRGTGGIRSLKMQAYKDSEVSAVENSNISSAGVIYGDNGYGGKVAMSTPYCRRADVTPRINMRDSAGVDMDTGFFDFWDNYISWTAKSIIGEPTGRKVLRWLPLYKMEWQTLQDSPTFTRLTNTESQKNFFNQLCTLGCMTNATRGNNFWGGGKHKTYFLDPVNVPNLQNGSYWPQSLDASLGKYGKDASGLSFGEVLSNISTLGLSGTDRIWGFPDGTTTNMNDVFSLALKTGVAKYWIELAENGVGNDGRRFWVNLAYVEPCRTGNKEYSTNQDNDVNRLKSAEHGKKDNEGNTIYYKSILDKTFQNEYNTWGRGDRGVPWKKDAKIVFKDESLEAFKDRRWGEICNSNKRKCIDDVNTTNASYGEEIYKNLPLIQFKP